MGSGLKGVWGMAQAVNKLVASKAVVVNRMVISQAQKGQKDETDATQPRGLCHT
jgi:hypothetical protein